MPTRLQLAKRRREKLKEKLFWSKVKKIQWLAQECRGELGMIFQALSLFKLDI